MEALVLALRLVLAAVFATAGVAKLQDREGSRQALEDFGMPAWFARPGGILLPLAEIAIAIALLFPPTATGGALAAAALLGVFVAAIANAMAHGRAPDCHCFGQVHSEPAGWRTLARNGLLIALSMTVAVAGPGPAVDSWIGDRSGSELVLIAAGLAALAVTTRLVVRWNRRRAKRREEKEFMAMVEEAKHPAGRPIGSRAPSFALPRIDGEGLSLESLCARGRPVLLVFVDVKCQGCRELLPKLGEWESGLAERLTIAVLSQGTAEVNRPLAEEHGLTDFLLQKRSEIYEAYGARGTPSGVVVSTDGSIASDTVGGPMAIEDLVRVTLRRSESWKPTLAT